MNIKICSTCKGKGTVPCPRTYSVRGLDSDRRPQTQVSTGFPIPCPTCKGKKYGY